MNGNGQEKKMINKEYKKYLDDFIGQKVILRGSLGRNKSFEKQGTLVSTTDETFLVMSDNGWEKINYGYRDIFTKSVEFSVNDGGQYNSILNVINNHNQNQGVTL